VRAEHRLPSADRHGHVRHHVGCVDVISWERPLRAAMQLYWSQIVSGVSLSRNAPVELRRPQPQRERLPLC
jgi:hypothetical protein